MKRVLTILLTLAFLLALSPSYTITFGQEPSSQDPLEDVDDDAEVSRVARLSFVAGDVSFLRAGASEWAAAVENLPLLAGDQIYTASGARAEIQLARGSYIRLAESTALTIADLSDAQSQFEVTSGTAIFRVERFASAFQRFEVDTPNSALVLKEDGLYRVEVRSDDESEVIVRSGAAEVSTSDSSFNVKEGQRLSLDTGAQGRIEIAADDTRDDWDRWSYDRDSTIHQASNAVSPDYVSAYETTYNNFYGAAIFELGRGPMFLPTALLDSKSRQCWRRIVRAAVMGPEVRMDGAASGPGAGPRITGRWCSTKIGCCGPRLRQYHGPEPVSVTTVGDRHGDVLNYPLRAQHVGWYPCAGRTMAPHDLRCAGDIPSAESPGVRNGGERRAMAYTYQAGPRGVRYPRRLTGRTVQHRPVGSNHRGRMVRRGLDRDCLRCDNSRNDGPGNRRRRPRSPRRSRCSRRIITAQSSLGGPPHPSAKVSAASARLISPRRQLVRSATGKRDPPKTAPTRRSKSSCCGVGDQASPSSHVRASHVGS